ncbi:MAG: DUF3224 domain-containing protein [Gemmatimonadetes bacterium]|nr:DUF3224 domain-containing protein [Gemmatimonadota bacterium]
MPTTHATGTFEVKLAPQAVTFEESGLGRLSIDKQFQGDLQAASKGEMLAYRTAVQGSAGYVALERVDGTLHARGGTFVLQHSGTMNRGVQQLALTVVPDSATGGLEGLSGSMKIIIEDGRPSYEFDYDLP